MTEQQNRSIRRAIMSLWGGTLLVLLGVIGISLYISTYRTEVRGWHSRQREAADHAAHMVELLVQETRTDLDRLVQSDLYAPGAPVPTLVDGTLFSEIVVYNGGGRPIAASSAPPPLMTEFTRAFPAWQQVVRREAWMATLFQPAGEAALQALVFAPQPNGNLVVGAVPASAISEILSHLRLGAEGAVYLVDTRQKALLQPAGPAVGDPAALLSQPDFAALLARPGGQQAEALNGLGGKPAVVVTLPVPGAPWVVVTEMPRGEALAGSRATAARLAVGLLALAFVTMTVTGRLLNHLVIRRIRELRDGAARLGSGELSFRFALNRRDEIGMACAAFNDMARGLEEQQAALAHRIYENERLYHSAQQELQERKRVEAALQEAYAEMEQRVAARTAELAAANAALEVEVGERRRAEDAATASERRYRSLIEHSSDCITLMDAQGCIVYNSPSITALLGYDPTEWVGRSAIELLHPADQPEAVAHLTALAQGACGGSETTQFRYQHQDGSWRWLEAIGTNHLADPVVAALVINTRDITERKAAEAALNARIAVEHMIGQVAGLFIHRDAPQMDDAIRKALQQLGGFIQADRCYIIQFDFGLSLASNTFEWCAPGILPQQARLQNLRVDNYAWWMNQLQQQGFVQLGSLDELPQEAGRERTLLAAQQIQSLMVTPVNHAGQLVGFVGVDAVRQSRQWSNDDLALLRVVGEIIGSAIAQRDIDRERALWARRLEGLHAVGLHLATQASLETLLETICARAMELLGGSSGGFFLYRPETGDLERVVNVGEDGLPLGTRFRPGEGLSGRAFNSRKTEVVQDFPHWTGLVAGDESRRLRSLIAVPVIAGEDMLGVLNVGYDQPARFGPEDQKLIGLFASQAASAIRNAQIVAERERQRRQAEALLRANQALTSSLDLNTLLQNVLRAAVEVIPGAEKGSVLLVDEGSGELHFRALAGYQDERITVERLQPGESYAYQVLRDQQARIVEDAHAGPIRYQGAIPEISAIRSAMAAPLVAHGQVIGVITLDNATRPGAFSPDDLALLVSFGHQAALAIENASQFEGVRQIATYDHLTQLYTRRSILERMEERLRQNRAERQPAAIFLWDVDHFKDVNDRYGHRIGDAVLYAVAQRCKASLREFDLVGRWGGDEFIALLPETSAEQALQAARRLQEAVSAEPFAVYDQQISVSISLGVAPVRCDTSFTPLVNWIDRADQALYQAKQAGRNDVCMWTAHPEEARDAA